MSEHVIETRDLTVYYGKHRGILDVNLTVDKGEVFGFLGPMALVKQQPSVCCWMSSHPRQARPPYLVLIVRSTASKCASVSATCRVN